MSKLQQVTVTIGRNVGTNYLTEAEAEQVDTFGVSDWPTLSDAQWTELQARVTSALANTVNPSCGTQVFRGEGEWDGVKEESALFVALGTVDEVNRFALLRGELLKIAYNFRQDAIALAIHGESSLIEAEPVI